MNTKENILCKTVSTKALFLIILFGVIVLMLPMLYIARYDFASVDDFHNGAVPRHVYLETGSIAKVVATAAQETVKAYYSWQGSYSAVFLMCIQPAVFGEQFYPITPLIMLAALISGIFILCYTVFRKVFGADSLTCGIIALIECLLCTQFLPMPTDSFYWFCGSVYYTFFLGISFICYALIIKYLFTGESRKRRPALGIGIVLLLLFIAGGNYSTALLTAELLFLAVILLLFQKNAKWKDLTLFLAVFIVAFLGSVVAPGNAVRGGGAVFNQNPLPAVLRSFKETAIYLSKWTSLPVVACVALLVPIFLNFCDKKQFHFKLPALVSIVSLCLLASTFCPPIYAQGYFGFRLLNIVYFEYMFLLFFNVFYWTGWITRKVGDGVKRYGSVKLWFAMTVLALFTVGAGLLAASGNVFTGDSGFLTEKQNVTSAYAMVSLVNGGAKRYYEQNLERLALLKDDSIKELALEPFDYRPGLLFVNDITEYSTDWMNIVMCEFYDKDKVWLSGPYTD